MVTAGCYHEGPVASPVHHPQMLPPTSSTEARTSTAPSVASDILSDLLHEIAGATHTIVGYADLLDSSDDLAAIRRHVVPIRQIAQRLNRIASGVAYSHSDEPVPVEPLHLDEVVTELVDRRRTDLAGRGMEVRNRLANVPLVLADRERLERALDVVLDHALGHGPRGLGFVAFAEVDPSQVTFLLSVPGVDLDRLTRRLVVHLTSRAGGTATFGRQDDAPVVEIRLPRAVNDEDAPPSPRILHVDDDAPTRDLVDAVLTAESMVVIPARDLDEARRVLATESVDLLLVDQRLGDERGIDLVRSIRSHPDRASLPVVVMSAETDPDFEREVEALGAQVIRKPVANDELVVVVLRTMSAYY